MLNRQTGNNNMEPPIQWLQPVKVQKLEKHRQNFISFLRSQKKIH